MTQGGIFMVASKQAYDYLEDKEKFRARVYTCQAGHATIGFGHLLRKGPPTESDKKLVWSIPYAREIMGDSVRHVEAALNRAVRVHLDQNQFDALVCFTYNLGVGILDERKCSWLRELNKGYYEYVPALMSLYNKVEISPGKYVVSDGLVIRREEEGKMFATPVPTLPPDPAVVAQAPEAVSIYNSKTKTQFPENWR